MSMFRERLGVKTLVLYLAAPNQFPVQREIKS